MAGEKSLQSGGINEKTSDKEGNPMLRVSAALLAIVLFGITGISFAGDWTGNINAFMGMKTLSDDWADEFQEQTEGGILFDLQKRDWPVCGVIESMYSMKDDVIDGVDLELITTEILLGVGKNWAPNSTIRPYVRAGIVFATTELNGSNGSQSESISESGNGYGISGGVYWTISQHFNLGLGVRYTKAVIDFDGLDQECGGTHSGLVIGYHW